MVCILCVRFLPCCTCNRSIYFGSPLFEKAEISLSNGKKLKIRSDNNSPLNFYIKGVNLNGSKYNNNWLSHSELTKGPKIDFRMQSVPSAWGSDESSVPYSMTDDK